MMKLVTATMMHALSPEHPERLRAESVLGACLAGSGKMSEGMPLLTHAYQTLLSTRGKDDRYTLRAQKRLQEFSKTAVRLPDTSARHNPRG